MKIFNLLATLLAVKPGIAVQVTVSYDNTYDSSTNSMNMVACSDGPNGLITRYGFRTFGEIPCHIASSSTVPRWNADTCGQCLQVDYNGKSIYVLAIDSKPDGLDIAEGAMNLLTDNRAYELGIVQAEMTPVDVGMCGLQQVGGSVAQV